MEDMIGRFKLFLAGQGKFQQVARTHRHSDDHNQAHGADDHTNRTRSFWLGASSFTLRTGTPVLAAQGSNTRYRAWAMDATTIEAVVGEFVMPADYVSGAITTKLYWTNLGAGAGNVDWAVALGSTADGGDLNGVFTSLPTDVVAAPTLGLLDIYTHSVSLTPGASPQVTRCTISRVGNSGTDTLANDAGLIGLLIEYTSDM